MRLSIVDGYSTGSVLAGRLAAAGARLVHVSSLPTVSSYFARSFHAGDYEHRLDHVDNPRAVAARLRELDVRVVVAGTESGVVLADTLNNLLGTPGNSAEQIAARRDKELMARTVAAAGLATPEGEVFDDATKAANWFAARDWAHAVVKPLRSAGTDNVHFCADATAVRSACQRVLGSVNIYGEPNDQVLVQERVHGTEYYVNTVSDTGVHKVAELWRYQKTLGPGSAPIYDFEEPVGMAGAEAAGIRTFVFAVLDALGIRHGAAHTEVMLTGRGLVLIECAARLGGATRPEVVERFSGRSQTGMLVETLLRPGSLRTVDDRGPDWRGHVRCVELINPIAGRVRSDGWLTELHSLPSAVAVSCSLSVGDEAPATADLLSSPGYVYLAASDPRAIERDYRKLRELERAGLYTSGYDAGEPGTGQP